MASFPSSGKKSRLKSLFLLLGRYNYKKYCSFVKQMSREDFVAHHFGNRLRLRVCGICTLGDRLLLVKHRGLGPLGELWIPPGGEVEWGQPVPENLEREFREETGLEVQTGDFLFVHEHLQPPLHAVELFFSVQETGGSLKTGMDPELPPDRQLIQEARYFSFPELKALGAERLHAMLQDYNSLEELKNAKGYFKFGK